MIGDMGEQIGTAISGGTDCLTPPHTGLSLGMSHGIVAIHKAQNGFICKVGCKVFVSKDWKEISDGLAEYWLNPVEAEKKFCK